MERDPAAPSAQVTPDDIVAFVVDMVENRRPGYRIVQVSYPTATARMLGRAKWALETFCAWKPDSDREKRWGPTIEAIKRIVQCARVDKEADRVWFTFEAGEIELIRESIQALDEFATIKAADARRPNRGRRK